MRLQRRPLKNYTKAPIHDIQFTKRTSPPDDMAVLPIDTKYLTYFITEMPSLLGCERFFPSAIQSIFKLSVDHPVLRHSILAVSSWIVDNQEGRTPLYTHQHLQRILSGIQRAIDVKINVGHILSVQFLSWLALMTGDLHTTHRHLRGLFLMFHETRHLSLLAEPHNNPDPLIMFLYRMSIKIDNTLAYRNFPLTYPPLTDHEYYHRQWLPSFISDKHEIENCLAEFKLDDLTNHICHLHYRARQLGAKRARHPEIQNRAKLLVNEHAAWLQLPVVKQHIPTEIPIAGTGAQNESRFLEYPMYNFPDMGFAEMYLIHASLGIHLSIVMTGQLGPYPNSRCESAIQVCRIYAALGKQESVQKAGEGGVITALWLAGLVLGSHRYPAGSLHLYLIDRSV